MHDAHLPRYVSAQSLEDAGQWLLDLQTHPERFEDFDRWLHSDDEHFEAWARVNRVWDTVGKQPATTKRHWPRRTRLPLLAAACVSAMAVCAALVLSPGWRADYSTSTAQTREVILSDGSRLTLAPQSAVNVSFNDRQREVMLVQGEVFFEVVHDARKPFEVRSEDAVIRVLGTAFDVARRSSGLSVEVRDGTVGVNGQYRLAAGQRVWIDRQSGLGTQSAVTPTEVAGWVNGSQFFENASVAQVVEQLDRYQPGWIVIQDPALANKRVTGLYDMRDTQRALQALVAPIGGEVRQYSALLTVIGSKKPTAEK
ncbi:FecR domain-containing protein [Pseudomonas sp. Bout1]|uniref:FecR family protein n=1 Tax=Pseudomonas sp. Bout1 TaxID=3048600 RepID=UPI002AB4ADBE|nr:FecR domain-containing protein [Pseudomonas sp. Bout1]MDY7534795.1 FecR domain-containing protein [Pseudomonas sp. Bout1]MEB0183904.1 FecR domain-containing protein [Pseudomonas sp. Bout1]